MPTLDEIQAMIHTLRQTGCPVAARKDGLHSRPFPLHYRNNADGMIRCLWPAGSRQPHYLQFHHPNSRKAVIMDMLTRFLFRIGAGRLFASGSVLLFIQPVTVAAAASGPGRDFAISIDPPGANRSALLWCLKQGEGAFTRVIPILGSTNLIGGGDRSPDRLDRVQLLDTHKIKRSI